jgi:hypothetical protein
VRSLEGKRRTESVSDDAVVGKRKDKGKGREISPANTSTTVSRDGRIATAATGSHIKKIIGKCNVPL